jgi:hypothetical protein
LEERERRRRTNPLASRKLLAEGWIRLSLLTLGSFVRKMMITATNSDLVWKTGETNWTMTPALPMVNFKLIRGRLLCRVSLS